MNQLGLPISLDSKMLLDNFLGNNQLLDFFAKLYLDKTSAEIYVYGASGLGKTHLLQGATLRALSDQQSAMYINCNNSLPEHVLESIEQLNWISIDSKVYEYLFKYYSRDVKVLLKAIDDLDKASLQAKQSITIPFVRKTLRL